MVPETNPLVRKQNRMAQPERGCAPGFGVTVVIPCYNYGRYLPDAVQSVQSQTLPGVDILVVNDGSDDVATQQILRDLEQSGIRICHQSNQKTSAARNAGIKAVNTSHICCLDADDCLAPDYLEKCLAKMNMDQLSICGSWQQNMGEDTALQIPDQFDLQGLLQSNRMIYAAVFLRSLWEKIGGYDEAMREGYEDWEFWIRAAAAGTKAGIVPEPLFYYRKHGRSRMDDAVQHHDAIMSYMRHKHARLYAKAGHADSTKTPGKIWPFIRTWFDRKR